MQEKEWVPLLIKWHQQLLMTSFAIITNSSNTQPQLSSQAKYKRFVIFRSFHSWKLKALSVKQTLVWGPANSSFTSYSPQAVGGCLFRWSLTVHGEGVWVPRMVSMAIIPGTNVGFWTTNSIRETSSYKATLLHSVLSVTLESSFFLKFFDLN